MATLPANSTFLPVLDDLLSPDFRTSTIPGQTPQTPAETPLSATAPKSLNFGENHIGQLTGKTAYGGVKKEPDVRIQNQQNGNFSLKDYDSTQRNHSSHHHHHAASKIQKWWKSRQGKQRYSNGTVDIKVERVKHSIRHNRTEEHVRYLETEVHRLKSALATERKLRSLQLEAIRSLWSQVQKVSSISSSSPPSAAGDSSIMSQSMPNGLPIGNRGKETSGGVMSMSLHSGFESHQKQDQNEEVSVCSCTKEIQNLRESLTGEMVQLRKMIDQLRVDGKSKTEEEESENGGADESRISQQKRPLTLNLVGISSKTQPLDESSERKADPTEKKEISGYADQMASNILEDAKETDDMKE